MESRRTNTKNAFGNFHFYCVSLYLKVRPRPRLFPSTPPPNWKPILQIELWRELVRGGPPFFPQEAYEDCLPHSITFYRIFSSPSLPPIAIKKCLFTKRLTCQPRPNPGFHTIQLCSEKMSFYWAEVFRRIFWISRICIGNVAIIFHSLSFTFTYMN